MATIKYGKITSYERNRGRGEVALDDGGRVSFSAGTFDSGWPVRPPRANDEVSVRLSEGSDNPLYVRLRKPQPG